MRARTVRAAPGPWMPAAVASVAALLAVALAPTPAAAQSIFGADEGRLFAEGELPGAEGGVVFRSGTLEREIAAADALVNHDGPYIVVHLGENRVFVFQGPDAVWSAPAGTGTGFRLDRGGEHQWRFSTPRGLFKVKRMEKDPLWEAPDWYYLENDLPIPPQNSPAREMRGMMGTTALYLGDGIAIHGTNRPELLLASDPEARRVSHGCIRLTNEAARTLFHMVDVGTPVLIF